MWKGVERILKISVEFLYSLWIIYVIRIKIIIKEGIFNEKCSFKFLELMMNEMYGY